jgi:hypothetical protein
MDRDQPRTTPRKSVLLDDYTLSEIRRAANLEPEDLVGLTVEAAAMAEVLLAGTDWIPGRSRY